MNKELMLTRVLTYSIKAELGHIPSALSMLNYVYELFSHEADSEPVINPSTWNIVLGKPFGAQTYYKIWEYFYMLDISNLSYGVKHEEISFVDFSEETLGNALGVASGISYNGRKTWCNISDAALQMGPTLEAIQFVGHHKQDIMLTIDYNRTQLLGNTTQIMGSTESMIYDYFYNCGWRVYSVQSETFDKEIVRKIIEREGPVVFIISTIKGNGVVEMMEDPIGWHYKELKDINEITLR